MFSWPHAQAHCWHMPTSYIIFASETNLVSDLATLSIEEQHWYARNILF